HPGEPRLGEEPADPRQVGASWPGPGHRGRTAARDRRQPDPPLWSAHRRRPRAAGPPHPPRGLRPRGDDAMSEPLPASGARLALLLGGLGLVVLAVSLGALFIGSARVPPGDVLAVLTGRVKGVDQVVVLSLRLPRILVALLAGGALAVAGAGFQALARNPLAEPSVLGVSSGAAFGGIVAQVFGLGGSLVGAGGLAAWAFAGALGAGGAVYLIASRAGGLPVHTLLLAGVIVGIFFSSAITVLISVVDFDRLGGVVHWLLGNLSPIAPASLAVFAALTALGGWLVFGAR